MGPILIASLSDPSTAVKVEGINYFADTLLFAGAILALASATPRTRLECRLQTCYETCYETRATKRDQKPE